MSMRDTLTELFASLADKAGLGGSVQLDVLDSDGGTQRVPVLPVEHDGRTYVVASGKAGTWVSRLRLSRRARLPQDTGLALIAREVPAKEREGVLAAYRDRVGESQAAILLDDTGSAPVFELLPDEGSW
ncbi:MAG: hypothetical protein LWW86_01570 [Micrococcales bacterium]|nr:hypothetical protein [Micrococcales bacterium]